MKDGTKERYNNFSEKKATLAVRLSSNQKILEDRQDTAMLDARVGVLETIIRNYG